MHPCHRLLFGLESGWQEKASRCQLAVTYKISINNLGCVSICQYLRLEKNVCNLPHLLLLPPPTPLLLEWIYVYSWSPIPCACGFLRLLRWVFNIQFIHCVFFKHQRAACKHVFIHQSAATFKPLNSEGITISFQWQPFKDGWDILGHVETDKWLGRSKTEQAQRSELLWI